VADEPASTQPPDGPAWTAVQRALQIIGGGAALLGWLAIIGGWRMYLRFQAAQLPSPVRTVSVVPRETLIAEGLKAMAVPLFAGALVAVLVLVALTARERVYGRRFEAPVLRPEDLERERQYRRERRAEQRRARVGVARPFLVVVSWLAAVVFAALIWLSVPSLVIVILLGVLAGLALWVLGAVEWSRELLFWLFAPGRAAGWPVTAALAAVLIMVSFLSVPVAWAFGVAALGVVIVVILAAIWDHVTPGQFALALFASVAFVAGLAAVVRENESDSIAINRARAELTDPPEEILGWFVARSGDDLFLALSVEGGVSKADAKGPKRLKVIPNDRVSQLFIGPDNDIPTLKRPTPTSTPTVTAAPPKVTAAPPKVTATPPKVTAAPPKVTAAPPKVTATPPKVTATPPTVTPTPPKVTATPPTVTPTPKPGTVADFVGPKMPPLPSDVLVPDRTGSFSMSLGRFREPVTGSVQFLTHDALDTGNSVRQVSVATVPFHSRADGGTHVRVRLSSTMARLLDRYGRIDVDVQVVARDMYGNAGTQNGCIVLSAKRPPENQSHTCG
jgi:hypothetical protein